MPNEFRSANFERQVIPSRKWVKSISDFVIRTSLVIGYLVIRHSHASYHVDRLLLSTSAIRVSTIGFRSIRLTNLRPRRQDPILLPIDFSILIVRRRRSIRILMRIEIQVEIEHDPDRERDETGGSLRRLSSKSFVDKDYDEDYDKNGTSRPGPTIACSCPAVAGKRGGATGTRNNTKQTARKFEWQK